MEDYLEVHTVDDISTHYLWERLQFCVVLQEYKVNSIIIVLLERTRKGYNKMKQKVPALDFCTAFN